MRWIAKPHSIVPLRRTFSWSLIGHTGLLAFLLVVSVLPAPRHRRMRVHASNTMTIRAFPTVSTRPEPKGEDRELEVENAVRPQEPPKATPAPVAKVTPAPRKVIERPTVKENVSMKKVLATPTPEIKKTPEPAPLKEVKAVATPEVKKSPPPRQRPSPRRPPLRRPRQPPPIRRSRTVPRPRGSRTAPTCRDRGRIPWRSTGTWSFRATTWPTPFSAYA